MNWNCPECHAKTEIPKQVPLNFCPMCGAEVRQKPRFGFKSIFTFLMLFYVPFAFFCIFAVLLWFLTPRNQSDTTKEISMKKVDADYVLSLPNYVTLVLKHIPPGSFIMGSPLDELGRDIDEKQHSVTIADEFWMGQYEVTFAQFYGPRTTALGGNPDIADFLVCVEPAAAGVYRVSGIEQPDVGVQFAKGSGDIVIGEVLVVGLRCHRRIYLLVQIRAGGEKDTCGEDCYKYLFHNSHAFLESDFDTQ